MACVPILKGDYSYDLFTDNKVHERALAMECQIKEIKRARNTTALNVILTIWTMNLMVFMLLSYLMLIIYLCLSYADFTQKMAWRDEIYFWYIQVWYDFWWVAWMDISRHRMPYHHLKNWSYSLFANVITLLIFLCD